MIRIHQYSNQCQAPPLRIVLLSCILLLLHVNAIFAANEKGLRRTSEKQVASFETQDKIAMIVGVEQYPVSSGLAQLQFAAADALALAEVLRDQGYQLIGKKPFINAQANAGDLRHYLKQLKKWVIQGEGTVLFSFSGHGFADGGKNYLAIHGTSLENVADTSLAIEEVEKYLQQSGAKRKLVFIDACRNNPDADGKKGALRSRNFILQKSQGIRMLFATGKGDFSYESPRLGHGVFSTFLLKGLRGDAAGKDGLITFHDLEQYVIKNVRNWSKANLNDIQTPYTAGEASGDFLIGKNNQFQLFDFIDEVMTMPKPGTNSNNLLWILAVLLCMSAVFMAYRKLDLYALFPGRSVVADPPDQEQNAVSTTQPVVTMLILKEHGQQMPDIEIKPDLGSGTVLGRSQKFCHMSLVHDALSRRHVRIIWDNDNKIWLIEDLNTLNGTDLDDEQLSPFTPVQLCAGQTLYIGELVFSVQTTSDGDLRVAKKPDDFLLTYRIDSEGKVVDIHAPMFHAELVKARGGELYLTDGLSGKGTFWRQEDQWQVVQQQLIEWTDKLKLGDIPTTAEALIKKLAAQQQDKR